MTNTPKDIADRDWLREKNKTSEAGIWLNLEKCENEDGRMTGFCGLFTLRDCQRSISIEMDDGDGLGREALELIRDYADKGLRWIERAEKRMRGEETDE